MDDVLETSDLVDLAAEDHPQADYFRVFKLPPGDSVGDDEKLRHDVVKSVGDFGGVKRVAFPLALTRQTAAVRDEADFRLLFISRLPRFFARIVAPRAKMSSARVSCVGQYD